MSEKLFSTKFEKAALRPLPWPTGGTKISQKNEQPPLAKTTRLHPASDVYMTGLTTQGANFDVLYTVSPGRHQASNF